MAIIVKQYQSRTAKKHQLNYTNEITIKGTEINDKITSSTPFLWIAGREHPVPNVYSVGKRTDFVEITEESELFADDLRSFWIEIEFVFELVTVDWTDNDFAEYEKTHYHLVIL